MRNTPVNKAKSKQKMTYYWPTPARGSSATLSLDFALMGGKPCGLSKNLTTGGRLSASGGQSKKSLSRSRLKLGRYGVRSKKQSRLATFTNNKTGEKFVVEHFLNKPIDSYQQLFEYLVPALVEYGYRRADEQRRG